MEADLAFGLAPAVTDLASTATMRRFRELFVISRNSAFVYKGKPINAQSVANELGVQYVVEGSVRRAGSRVRITAQLIDAETDRHLWAERDDRELADIFAIQDEVTFRLGQWSSISQSKVFEVKRCAVKCSSLIISQRCSGRRPEAFSGREPINIECGDGAQPADALGQRPSAPHQGSGAADHGSAARRSAGRANACTDGLFTRNIIRTAVVRATGQ